MNENEALKVLSEIKETLGMEFIEKYVKDEKKQNAKKSGRPSSGLLTATEVYFSLFGLDFDNEESYKDFTKAKIEKKITYAKEEVAEKNGTVFSTVDNHINTFNKFARKMDYFEFCEEFERYKNNPHYNDHHSDDFNGIKECILYYSKETQQYRNYQYETFGDSRYSGIDVRIAIAFYLMHKYYAIKNAHKVQEREDPNAPDWIKEDTPF